jgi:hypothetical protein
VLVAVAVLAAIAPGNATQLTAGTDHRALLRNSVRNKLSNELSKVGKFVKDTANDAGKGISDTANDAGKAVSDTANDAVEFVSDTANDAVEFVSDTANDAGFGASKSTKDAFKSASKKAQKAGKAFSKAGNDAYEYTSKVTSSIYNSCSAEVHATAKAANALLTQGTKLARPISQSSWNAIASDATKGWKTILYQVGSIESYVENDLIDDLEKIGDYIANELICTDIGMPATTLTCAVALAAAVCAATEGAAPGCFPESMSLMEKVAATLGLAAMGLIFRCSYYYVLKNIPGLCDGMAYGIATQIGYAATSDPYSIACNSAVYCGCGQCTYSCSYPGKETCEGSTYLNAMKDIGNAIKDLI